ncbi:hypothetical protein BT96DRAFT_1018273 [Gymnopus androsaceus JB14]|uniref:Uncharacterized protein n=1 Tax=Gymnopus androsaceus JB14 TaxID=1447944 RepID=A0A6A4HWN9_9AGAR|nr:hypothetical protein BT96DRAFT_1018273 [Gymnopus androsaceus JB14]
MKTNLHQWTEELILARLRNQELPDDLETQEIVLEIEDLEQRLSESVTGSSHASNKSLSNSEHDVLEQRLAYCRAFLAPVRRLPFELLAEIYHLILCSVRDNSPRPKEQLAPTRALVVLSHVCSFWRKACFSTTTLWNDIRIPSLFRNAKDARLVEMQLRYSGSSPLDIQIHNFGASREADMDSARDILEGLISHRERWRKVLVIGINTWAELNSACSTVHTQTGDLHFPSLESLLLRDADHSSVNAFSSADLPRLQTMEVHGYNPSSFPFHQLTSLSLVLDRRETRVFRLPRDFTDHLANLEHLHLEGEFNYLPNEIGCTDFEHALPKLKSLVIEVYSKPFLTLFLNTFRLPALLSIEIITPLQDWPQADFISLLTRSQRLSALTKLSLRWAQITDEQLLEILHLTESLEELKVLEDHTNTLSPSLFRAMSISSTPIIVPKLQHIFFSMAISEKECPVGIEMVASRSAKSLSSNLDSPSCVPLKSFMLFLILAYKPVEPPASLGKESLRALRESMEITVRLAARDAPVEENIL